LYTLLDNACALCAALETPMPALRPMLLLLSDLIAAVRVEPAAAPVLAKHADTLQRVATLFGLSELTGTGATTVPLTALAHRLRAALTAPDSSDQILAVLRSAENMAPAALTAASAHLCGLVLTGAPDMATIALRLLVRASETSTDVADATAEAVLQWLDDTSRRSAPLCAAVFSALPKVVALSPRLGRRLLAAVSGQEGGLARTAVRETLVMLSPAT
jgi:hypothetical protein